METNLPNDLRFVEKIHRIVANSDVGIIKNQNKSEENIKLNLRVGFRDLITEIEFSRFVLLLVVIFFVIWSLGMFYDNKAKQEQIELQIKTINKQNQELKQLIIKQNHIKSIK